MQPHLLKKVWLQRGCPFELPSYKHNLVILARQRTAYSNHTLIVNQFINYSEINFFQEQLFKKTLYPRKFSQ